MHGFGLNNSVTTLSSGGTIVLTDRGSFDGDCVIDLIERHRVSSLCLVGDAMSLPLLDVLDRSTERRELSSVRLIISAGVFWSAEVKSRLLAYFGKARLLDLLASSEAIGTGSARSSADSVAGSARFTPGPFTKVVTEGGEFVAPDLVWSAASSREVGFRLATTRTTRSLRRRFSNSMGADGRRAATSPPLRQMGSSDSWVAKLW